MDSRCDNSITEDNTTKVFELVITNPCSEPSEPVDISCVVKDPTAKSKTTTKVSKDGLTDSEPIFIDDLDNEVITAHENSYKYYAQKSIEADKETSNNVKVPLAKMTYDCNDNQKEAMESVIILDETNTQTQTIHLDQTKLPSGQLKTKKVTQNNNLESDIDLYETELQNTLNVNKRDSGTVRNKPTQNVKDTDRGKSNLSEKVTDNVAKKYSDPTTDGDIVCYATESQNVVKLNGNREDSDVILLDSKTTPNTTITQDNYDVDIIAKEYPPIDLVAEENSFSNSGIYKSYDNEFKENSLLSEVVQKCLNMERNGGMSRVINRTLLNIYKSVDGKYKKSNALRKVLTRTLMNLHMEPELKFSHIKSLCDHLKLHMVKKRVPFVTLEKRNTDVPSTSTIPNKKRRVEMIDLDNYAEKNQTTTAPMKPKEYPPIEIDSSSSIEEVNDVTVVTKEKAKKKKKKKKKKQKRGLAGAFIPTLVRNPFCTIPDPTLKEIPSSYRTEIPIKPSHPVSAYTDPQHTSRLLTSDSYDIGSIEGPHINSQPLLTPVVIEPVPLNSANSVELDDEARKIHEIEKIEKYIAWLREEIEKLEEMEVDADDDCSPYIVSEHYQTKLVKEYKRLCELTGTQEKKQHKVRLQVLPGHPEAPVRYLQEFLNDNIDEEGNPPFPDLHDVVECVCKANNECNMNWGQAQIMKEARSLFIQFGLTMQKRRQRREWRDLLSRVKEEVNDPAEQDAELMLKLNRNSWIAREKEKTLLDRYASLEESALSVRVANELSVRLENGAPEPETESSDEENANPRVPFPSIQSYDSQCYVGSNTKYRQTSITNGNIGIPATYGNQEIVNTISSSNGHIDIAPTYATQKNSIDIQNGLIALTPLQINSNNTFLNNSTGVNTVQNATLNTSIVNPVNGIQNVADPVHRMTLNHNFSMYALAFQNFTLKLSAALNTGKCNLCGITKSNACVHNMNASRVDNGNLRTVKNNVSPIINSNLTAIDNNVHPVNNVPPVNNRNVTSVNKSIVAAVKSEAQSKDDLETAAILAKSLIELVQKDVNPKNTNGNKNTANNDNVTQKSTDLEVKEEPYEKIDSVCDVFTHKTKPTNKNTVNENTEVKDKSKCAETKTANIETSGEIETEDVPIEDKVKPEPPDIPRMLAELGEDYTAVVFDIEDPFMVIEISDSSESEDEVT